MYRDLASFVEALERAGELVRVREPVSPVLAVARAADAASKSPAPHPPGASARRNDPANAHLGGPALLFEHVTGSDMPLLINAYGSYRRMEMALGTGRPRFAPREAGTGHGGTGGGSSPPPDGFEAIAAVMGELVKPQPPRSLGEAIAKARQVAPLLKIGPKRMRGRGPVQAVVRRGDDVDLTRLPIIRCWAHDGDYATLGYPAGVNNAVPGLGHPAIDAARWEAEFRGRYITLAGIHTIHADDVAERRPSSHNIGMYRVQLLGKDRVAMHWHMHHDGARHWRSWKALGQDMPVAIALGGPSVLPYAATAPLPPGISELLMAGFLNDGGIRMCRGVTVPLWVPADAEIVIEGYVSHRAGFPGWDPRETDEPLGEGAVFEGPFGDHTGFYSLPDRYPVVRVTAVTTRERPIYPTTVVGPPPQEDYFLGKATERLFLPLLKVLIPDVEDYDLPMFGTFHNCVFVKIRKHYPLHARRVMHAIWGAGQMAWTKTIFVVDHDVDVHDPRAVLEACTRLCKPTRDIETVHGALDILDHAAPRLGAGVKMGFDCTRKIPGEEIDHRPLVEIGAPGHEPSTTAEGDAVAGWRRAAERVDGVLKVECPPQAGGWCFVRVDRGPGDAQRVGLGRRVAREMEGLDASVGPAPAFIVIVGRDADAGSADDCLFRWLSNADPGRDALYGRRSVFFDATAKVPADGGEHGPVRAWPPMLSWGSRG